MYGLPKDFDCTTLEGLVLEQICFTRFQVALHFDRRTMIVIEGGFRYADSRLAQPHETPTFPLETSDLMRLLEHKVTAVDGRPNGTLHFTFDNGHILDFLDSSEHYESYHIRQGDRVIVV